MIRARRFFILLFVYGLAFFLFSLGTASAQTEQETETSKVGEPAAKAPAAPAKTEPKKKIKTQPKRFSKMYADFETSMGNFRALLYHNYTPKTVENFVALAEGAKEFTDYKAKKKVKRPFYDGLTFHRVIKGFMIQSGDPMGNGSGGPGYTFEDEFHPNLQHNRAGLLSMANYGPNTNGSQFFITLAETDHLDKKHTIFGEIVDGMDVVNKIGEVKVNRLKNDEPIEPVILKKVTIVRK